MLRDDLRAWLEELACDAGLLEPEAFAARANALDRLELVTLGLEDAFAGTAGSFESRTPDESTPGGGLLSGDLAALLRRAAAMKHRLVKANRTLGRVLRVAIRSGAWRGDEARRTLERLAGVRDPKFTGADGEYDLLDSLVSELLLDAEAPGATLPKVAERVAYQPTPARVVMELIDRAGLGPADIFYDLGAGLGHVCLLVNLLSGARARGIEVEPAYGRYARQQAHALRLAGVEFSEGDVREASLAGGTCYYLYTPFTGRTLAEALDRLAGEARQRAITVAAYGPCVSEVARQAWLERLDGEGVSDLAIFRSR